MRRCPKCNQEFADEWLTFCTQDGTSLVEVERRSKRTSADARQAADASERESYRATYARHAGSLLAAGSVHSAGAV